jgi:thymidylate synthase
MTTQVDPSNQTGTAFNKQDIKVSEAKLLRNAIYNERKARDIIKREHKKAMNGGYGQSNEAEKTPVTGGLIIPTGENTSSTVPPSQPSVPGKLCINFEVDLGKFSVQESLDQLRPILEMVKQVNYSRQQISSNSYQIVGV